MNPFTGVTLHTLGRFALAYRDQPCELAYEKGRALLGFLAMQPGRTYSRASLASMLWPEMEREAALTSLRQILLNLRQAFSRLGLSESPLHVDRESIRVHAGFGLCVDAVDLAAFAHNCPGAGRGLVVSFCRCGGVRKEYQRRGQNADPAPGQGRGPQG